VEELNKFAVLLGLGGVGGITGDVRGVANLNNVKGVLTLEGEWRVGSRA
jgi:hypothetical protein